MAAKHVAYQFDSRSPPDFASDRDTMRDLMRHSEDYQRQLNQIAARTRKVLELNLDDIAKRTSEEFATQVETNFVRYIRMLAEVVDESLPPRTADESKWDRIDVLMDTRERMMDRREGDDPARGALPKDLTRRFEIEISPRKDRKLLAVRDVGAEHIGRLVTVTGLVTRVSTVKPLVFVAAYVCDACGNESYQAVRSTQFMPLMECSSEQCRAASKQARMMLQTRTSRFLKHQELTLQESPDQVPVGAIPRSMRVLVRGESVRKCHAGEKVSITGVKVPLQKSGFRAMKAGLTTDTTFDAILIRKTKPGYADKVDEEDDEELEERIEEMAASRDCYETLSQSIAPEIFGMRDVKKALLLLMVGGVTKRMADGLTIRGDINAILMGDPGVAKSQLLKHICTIAPRAIYTTGKGSSGAGLTAAVVRDPVTDEMVLEGGALVLADMGIAAIDEFDKMEESDRTAIHEVMEQQTISISKAGICTTLNARASILAAANPVFGRYNKKKTPEENIELPAALMSRFDLMFILVDQPNRSDDEELARHICHVHQHRRAVPNELRLKDPSFLRAYIKKARTFEPTIPRELTQHVVGTYVQARNEGRQQGAKRLMPTPRTLLSVLRLSQALARLRFSDVVSEADIEEATRLWMESRASMLEDDDEEMQQRNQDVTTKIYTTIKDYMQIRDLVTAKMIDILAFLKQKGFFDAQIEETLDAYAKLDIFMINNERTKLTLIR